MSSPSIFNFVRSSRRTNPAATDHATHLLRLFEHFDGDDDSGGSWQRAAIPLAASSFVLDHYPPGMHRRDRRMSSVSGTNSFALDFDPRAVFRELYRDACADAGDLQTRRELSDLPVVPVDLVERLENEIPARFSQFKRSGSSREAHRRVLNATRAHWTPPSSEATCFCCIRRRPQYYLPCGHWICQPCVRVFCHPHANDPWLLRVDACMLCGRAMDLWIRVKPDTATTRVLSIDGGGARGRAPLEFLRVLEETIGLPYPVRRHFDVVFGTSSGECPPPSRQFAA